MSDLMRYVKDGQPDRLVSTPAQRVHAEFDGFKLADEAAPESTEPAPARRPRGDKSE